MSAVDFTKCDKYGKCTVMHDDMKTVEGTLVKIENHLSIGSERFKWIERAGWLMGITVITLIGYMISLSITNFSRHARLEKSDAIATERLKAIDSKVDDIRSAIRGE